MRFTILFAGICLCFFSIASYGQMKTFRERRMYYTPYEAYGKKGRKALQRYQVGLHLPVQNITTEQHYSYPGHIDPATGNPTIIIPGRGTLDTTLRGSYSSRKSWGVTGGTFFPLARLSGTSMFALDMCVQVNVLHYAIGTINYDSVTYINDDQGFCFQAMLPLAFVYKTGGEASLNKNNRFLFSMGAGIAPMLSATGIITSDLQTAARKFVMAEIGVYAGVAFKVRGTFFLDNVTMTDKKQGLINSVNDKVGHYTGDIDMSVMGQGGLNIALVFLPYSNHWGDEKVFTNY